MEETESFAHAAENALEASNGEDMSSNSMLCQNMSANKQAGITNSGGLCRLRLPRMVLVVAPPLQVGPQRAYGVQRKLRVPADCAVCTLLECVRDRFSWLAQAPFRLRHCL